MKRFWVNVMALLLALPLAVIAIEVSAQASTQASIRVPVEVPQPLAKWKQWVLAEHKDLACPVENNSQNRACVWVSTSAFFADDKGVSFTIDVNLYADGWIDLPGSHHMWPTGVQVKSRGNTEDLLVRENAGTPQVYLQKGDHQVGGVIPWGQIPQNIKIPRSSGIVKLVVLGKKVEQPEIDQNAQLWLRKANVEQQSPERNTEKIQVFRLIKDGNPARLVTRIMLDISGEAREIQAGKLLLDNFTPLSLMSELPARIEPNGDLRVQVKAGRWQITLEARHNGPLKAMAFLEKTSLWPDREIWSFQADRALRTVQLEGPLSLDPTQTEIPGNWRSYPAYHLKPGETLTLNEIHRGDPNPEANTFTLSRNLYLDFDGKGMTVSDELSGEMKQSLRLDSSLDYTLGSVSLNGIPQLITQSSIGEETQGVEVRQQTIKMNAIGRYEDLSSIHASGWMQNFDSVNAVLHLPPGWSLFASQGIDRATHSWVSRWNLWDIFLVLVIVVAVYRLCGKLPAVLAVLVLIMVYHRHGAPLLIWLNMVATLALLMVTQGQLKRFFGYYQLASFVMLMLLWIPFAVEQIRQSIYPQLEYPNRHVPVSASASQMHSSPSVNDEQNDFAPAPMEEVLVTAQREASVASMSAAKPSRPSKQRFKAKPASYEIDPNAIVQTGPGIPTWYWNRVAFSWNGPVAEAEQLRLYFVSPWLNRLGNVLVVVLSALFAGLLFMRSKQHLSLPKINIPAALLCVGFISGIVMPDRAHANVVIDNEILQELERRLTKPSPCLPRCASIEKLDLDVVDNAIALSMTVDALEHIAFGLPAWRSTWLPEKVLIGDKPAVIRVGQGGQLFARLPAGRHQITVSGNAYSEQLELRFGMPVHNITTRVSGWELNGLRKGYSQSGNIGLQRILKQDNPQDVLLADPMPPYVIVTRHLDLGLQWSVTTTVRRLSPVRGAFSVTLPLLEGESPLDEIPRQGKQVIAEFNANQHQVSWRSILTTQGQIDLHVPQQNTWTEMWSMDVSPIWHLDYEGIPPVKNTHALLPKWSPWPGEKLSLFLTRPAGVEGASLTVDSVEMRHDLGQRSENSTLRFKVRTSRGQNYPFTLPKGAAFNSLTINGVAQPLAHTNDTLNIPLQPGEQQVELKWHRDEGIRLLSSFPEVTFPQGANNIQLNLQLPKDRWPVFVGGPAMGPAVLIWGVLIVVVFVSIVLGKSKLTPLRAWHWVLLGVGVVSTNLYSPLLIVAWFFLMGLRGRMLLPKKMRTFHLIQTGLVLFSLLALAALLVSIPLGLLSHPQMHIVGNGSSAFNLYWYQDKIDGQLAQAWVFSLPMFVYRIVMLVWSLWLAFVLIDWLKWAWLQISAGGFWRPPELEEKDDNPRDGKTANNED